MAHRYRVQRPDDREARELRERIARERRATLEVGYGRSDDSDGLDVTTPSFELRFPLALRTTGMLGWRNDLTRDAGGTLLMGGIAEGKQEADRQRLSIYLGSRMVTPKARSDRDRRASPP